MEYELRLTDKELAAMLLLQQLGIADYVADRGDAKAILMLDAIDKESFDGLARKLAALTDQVLI